MSTFGTPATLNIGAHFGYEAPDSVADLKDILLELQGFRIGLATGGAQSAALSLRGPGSATGAGTLITTSDAILAALEFTNVAASGMVNLSFRNDVKVPSTGNVRFSGGATTNSHVLVFWWDKSGYISNA